MSGPGDALLAGVREQLSQALALVEPVRLEPGTFDRRAAATLILRPTEAGTLEALLVRRADVDGDPWSGHMALPGGREDPEDADLLDTARRETREETGVRLGRKDYLGRLDEMPPVTRRIPSISVTPFVAWTCENTSVQLNYELSSHVWIPINELRAPRNRGSYDRQSHPGETYPTIEYGGHTVWGLTFRVVEQFLALASPSVLEAG